jgi:hypothetical protein
MPLAAHCEAGLLNKLSTFLGYHLEISRSGPKLGPKLISTAWTGQRQLDIRLTKSPEKPDCATPANTSAYQVRRWAFSASRPLA